MAKDTPKRGERARGETCTGKTVTGRRTADGLLTGKAYVYRDGKHYGVDEDSLRRP
ncbi:MAG: hypothetical protein HN742_12100 [Lentisphaerae bacterium]|jgi:hypothetical protein|nr:hypothetical protein [Lentisphaerota bacterium]MBT5610603.1 hypothetical protein [Lentisphaerota bacterium]MBT7054488.1 hypothetical protein [Lentisphaerota bacterium]MBT7842610.1 hypothetical protein [Lentisphaerota bacterium]